MIAKMFEVKATKRFSSIVQVRRQDAEDGRNGIDRKDEVGPLDDEQHEEQRREAAYAVFLDPELVAMQVRREGEELPGDFDEEVLVHALAFVLVTREGQLDAGEQEECSEDRQQPGEALDGGDAGDDENRAHGHGADDAPEQDAVLKVIRNLEVREDQDEDEQVVDRKGELQDIAGGEQLGVLRTAPRRIEGNRRRRPGRPRRHTRRPPP